MSRSFQDPRLMFPCNTNIATGITTFLLPDGRKMQYAQETIEDCPERVIEQLMETAARRKGAKDYEFGWSDPREVLDMTRHPKYSAEKARFTPKTASPKDSWTADWSPTRLSWGSTDADRKKADEEIRWMYDEIMKAKEEGKPISGGWAMAATDYVDASSLIRPSKLSTKNPFEDHVLAFEYVGSRVTCSPPVMDTDEDILIWTDNASTLVGNCIEADFEVGGSKLGGMSEFTSLRKGIVNLIITESEEFFNKFMLATKVCKQLNVLEKSNRIMVFDAIMRGTFTLPTPKPEEDF